MSKKETTELIDEFSTEVMNDTSDVLDWERLELDTLKSSIDSLPEHILIEINRRLKIIKFTERELKGGWTEKNLIPILQKIPDKLKLEAPKWRTLVYWKSAYYESGRSVYSLAPQFAKCGNTTQKLDSQFFVDEAIDKKYLTKERLSVAEVYRYYSSRVITENKNIIDGKIQLLSERTFYNRIKNLAPYDVAVARYGKRYAEKEFRSVGKRIKATYPMEYVEIDHTPLPIILVDDELNIPICRPTLTMLFDCYSKCIVGLSVNFREPSFDSARKAILNAMLSKSWIKGKYSSIKNDWPCEGKIDNLVVDNGAEFWSQDLEESLRPFVTHIRYSPAAKPWRKSGIEKFFDQLSKGYIDKLPGKTFSNITHLKDYDPKKEASIKISTFFELLYKWIIDYYHMAPDSRETHIPYQTWQNAQFFPKSYHFSEEKQIRIEFGVLREREIQIAGIKLHNIYYQSKELINYRKYTSANSAKKISLKTKTDPTDISTIHVWLPEEQRYIKVPAVDPEGYTKGLSLFQHSVIRKVNRLKTRMNNDKESLAETQLYIDQRIEQEIEQLKSYTKKSLPKTSNMAKLAKYKGMGTEGLTSMTQNNMHLANEEKEITSEHEQICNHEDIDLSDIEGY